MQKRPKRDLKVKNLFNEGTPTNSQQSNKQEGTTTQQPTITNQVPLMENKVASTTSINGVGGITQIILNESSNVNKEEKISTKGLSDSQLIQEPKKKSKFQALKDKYIKKKDTKDQKIEGQSTESMKYQHISQQKAVSKFDTIKIQDLNQSQHMVPKEAVNSTKKSNFVELKRELVGVEKILNSNSPKTNENLANIVPIQESQQINPISSPKKQIISKFEESKDQKLPLFVQQYNQPHKNGHQQYKTDFKSIFQKQKQQAIIKSSIEIKQQLKSNKNPFQLRGSYLDNPPLVQAKKNFKAQTPQIINNSLSSFHDQVIKKPEGAKEVLKQKQISKVRKTEKINEIFLLKNPQQLICQILSNDFITENTSYYLKQKLFGKSIKKEGEDAHKITIFSKNPEFTRWVRTIFENFILKQEIRQQNYQLVNQLINQFFPPLGQTLPPIFVVMLCKLPSTYYKKFEDELVKNCIFYLEILNNNRKYISDKRREAFGQYILENLIRFYKSIEFCKLFIEVYSQFPQILKDQMLTEFSQQCNSFAYAAIVHLLACKYPSKSFAKGFISNLFFVVKCYQDKQLLEEAVNLLDNGTSIVGTSYYPTVRELRSKLIVKLEAKEAEARKSSKGGLFGFFNQALDMITNPKTSKDSASEVPIPQQTKNHPIVKRNSDQGNR